MPTQQFTHRIAAGHMPQRTVLKLTGGADDRALAVTLDTLGRHVHRGQQAARHVQPDGIERLHHRQDVRFVAAGKGVGQHGGNRAAPQWCSGAWPALVPDVFDLGVDASDVDHVYLM